MTTERRRASAPSSNGPANNNNGGTSSRSVRSCTQQPRRPSISFDEDTTIRWIKSLGEGREVAPLVYDDYVTVNCQQTHDLNNVRKDMKKTIKAYRRLWASFPTNSLRLSFEDVQPSGRSMAPRRFSQGDAADVEICLRGLEHLTSESALRGRVEEKSSAVQAVLSLQRDLRASTELTTAERPVLARTDLESGILLATRYSALTRIACERAQAAAKVDEAEAY